MSYARYERYNESLRTRRRERILFCHHPAVITMGVQTRADSVRSPQSLLAERGIELVRARRGGDVTAHEPGQLVVYPHIDLRRRGVRIADFVKGLLDVTAEVVSEEFGIHLRPDPAAPGLYAEDGSKVVSAGVGISKGFSSSGIALNWNNSLSTFAFIHPCGHAGLRMQSLAGLLARKGAGTQSANPEKRSDLLDEARKREFCRLWADRFLQSPFLQPS